MLAANQSALDQLGESQLSLQETYMKTYNLGKQAARRAAQAEEVQDAFHAWAESFVERNQGHAYDVGAHVSPEEFNRLVQLVTASNLARGLRTERGAS